MKANRFLKKLKKWSFTQRILPFYYLIFDTINNKLGETFVLEDQGIHLDS